MKNPAILLLFAAALLARAAVPLEWSADIERPATAAFTVLRGETVNLRARLVRRGAPYDPAATSAALYLQTNGMGRLWVAAPASVVSNVLSAAYTTSMMGDAAVVNAFLGARDADGSIYRAFALLRTVNGPGEQTGGEEGEIEIPALDFDAFTYTNAPWATENYVANAIADALKDYTPGQGGGIVEEFDPLWRAWSTNRFSRFHGRADTLRGDLVGLPDLQVSDIMTADNDIKLALRAAALASTNYTDTAAVPVTRKIAGVALDADLPLAGGAIVTNNNLRIYDAAPDGTLSNLLWDSSAAADTATVSNLAGRVAAVEAIGGATLWGNYDAQGHPNADSTLLLLNRAYNAIGSGFYWASSGGHYCLSSSGEVAFLAPSDGALRIFGESISNYVGIVRGGSVVVGARASGFNVTSNTASITYPYSGGDHPIIYGAATLAGPWTEMANPVWVDTPTAGTATATFPTTGNAFFYKATTTAQMSEYWRAEMPSYFPGGVKTRADDLTPVVFDSTITITQGGHTYRLPAQLMQ